MTNLLYIIDNHAGGMGLEEFTFFIGTMALMGASAFFFLSLSQFDKKWRNSILISGLITFIAAVHYYYMRGELGPDGSAGDITSIRYIDWILTVPLMCVEFYLLLKVAGATTKHLRDLIVLSLVMLITGYVGEAGMGNAALWGLFSGLAYFAIVYMIKYGDLSKLAKSAGGSVRKSTQHLILVCISWLGNLPIGYMIGTADGQWYSFMANVGLDMNVVYNIGDAINKIGFGLVVYAAAVKETK